MFEGTDYTSDGLAIFVDDPDWSSEEDVVSVISKMDLPCRLGVCFDKWRSFYLVPLEDVSEETLRMAAHIISQELLLPVEVGDLLNPYV